ncbi:ski oncogene-like [Sabethes cyaneus]|uniref:ski oncogene-like n=1 Tax=Sabethes cyaneus TaxID=53552 RepID=UPI00237EC2F3|nr:ski oncogene-like [Sabethes cyaneus]
MTEYVPPQLITVLKTYQDNAPKGLHGPGLSLVHPSKSSAAGGVVGPSGRPERPETPEHTDEPGGSLIVQPITGPLPMPSHPIMTTPDPDCGVVQLTMLEGKKIGCFLLGGEMRLCLPQIFNNILMDFSVEQINRSIQELMIYLYNCTDQQLQEFKRANIIPETAKTCGLITRTNAERLCSYMLHQADSTRNRKGATTSFRVYHRCFGKAEGIFTAELYSYKEPACIECCECQGMFSPQKFVCHQHNRHENRTCHWGFNSSNWRAYIHVALDEENRDAYVKILEEIWSQERDTEMEFELERDYWINKRKVSVFLRLVCVPVFFSSLYSVGAD